MMHRLRPDSIRGALLILLLVVLVPVFLVQAYIYYGWSQVRRESELQANLELARSLAVNFDGYVRHILREELSIGGAFTVLGPLTDEQMQRFLAVEAQEHPSVHQYSWIDPQGRVIASGRTEFIGADVSDRSYIREILGGRDWVVSDLFREESSGRPVFAVAQRIRGADGSLRAIVAAEVETSALEEVVAVERSALGAVVVVDRRGFVVYRYPEVEMAWEARDWSKKVPQLVRALAGEEVVGEYDSPVDGQRRLGGFVPISSIGWAVVANRPEAKALAPVNDRIPRDFGLLFLGGAAAVLVSFIMAREIIEPARRLREHALAIGQGDFGHRVEIAWPVESSEVGNAFNRMAEEIQVHEEQRNRAEAALQEAYAELAMRVEERTAELAKANEELRQEIGERQKAEELMRRQLHTLDLLIQSARNLAETIDLAARTREVCRAVTEIFGAKTVWVGRTEPDGRVYPLEWAGIDAEHLREVEIRWDDTPLGGGPTGRAIRSGQPAISWDIASDPTFTSRSHLTAQGFRTAAAFPLVSGDYTFGSLSVYSDEPDFFGPDRIALLHTYSHIAASALKNAELAKETRRHLQRVDALRSIDLAINASLDLRTTASIILDQVTAQLGVDAASLLLFNEQTHTLEYAAGRGFRSAASNRSRLRLGEGFAGRAALERRIVVVSNMAEAGAVFTLPEMLAGEAFVGYGAVPLVAKGQLKGVLEVFRRSMFDPDSEQRELLDAFGSQAAIAVDNVALFEDLQRSNVELALAYDTTIEGWSRALDLRDKETDGHCLRVTEMTLDLARILGLSEAELVHVRRGALLHDIGKMGIPDGILLKPGPVFVNPVWPTLMIGNGPPLPRP